MTEKKDNVSKNTSEKENKDKFKTDNQICNTCIFWKKFGRDCWVYWEKKKYCSMRVTDSTGYEDTKERFKINGDKNNKQLSTNQ